MPCFVAGTKILTEAGWKNVEELVVGDRLKIASGDFKPIRWIGQKTLSPEVLSDNPQLRPIRIQSGALGENTPKDDLIVSPQHRIVVRSTISERMFGPIDVLVSAKRLLDLRGIDVVTDEAPVAYYHVLLDAHEVIFANGARTESLLAGPEAMRAMGDALREEIESLLPDAFDAAQTWHSSHVVPSKKKQSHLVGRHVKNNKFVCG